MKIYSMAIALAVTVERLESLLVGAYTLRIEGGSERKSFAPEAKLKKRVYALANSNRKMKNKNLLHRTLVQNNPEPKSRNAADHFLSILHTRRLI